ERARLVTERQAVETRRQTASCERQKLLCKTIITDVAAELAKDPTLIKAVDQLSETLEVRPAIHEFADVAAELRTTAGYLPAVWRLVRYKTWSVVLAASFVVLALATAALVARGGWASLGSVATALASVSAVAMTAIKFLRPAAKRVNAGLALIENAV